MIKSIKVTSIIAAVLLLVGSYFKTMHWPGANVLMIVGAITGIFMFISLVAIIQSKLSGRLEKFSVIIASLALIVALLSFLFKTMHWQGAAILIWAADISILLAAVTLLTDGLFEKENEKWSLKIIAAFFAIFLLLIIMLVK